MHARAKNEKPSKIPRMVSQILGVMWCRAGESPEVSDVISQVWPAPISYAGVALIEGGLVKVKGTRSFGNGRSSAEGASNSSSSKQQPTGVRDEISWASYVALRPVPCYTGKSLTQQVNCTVDCCITTLLHQFTIVPTPIGPRPLQHTRAKGELDTLRQRSRSTLDHAFNRYPRVSPPPAYNMPASFTNNLPDCSKTMHIPLSRSEQTASQHSANLAHPISSTS